MCSLKDLLWLFRLYRSICHLNYLQVIKNVDRSVVCFLCSRFHPFSLSIIKRSWNMTQTKIEQFSRKTCFLKDLVSLSASNVRSVTFNYLQLIKNVNSLLVCFLCVLDFTLVVKHGTQTKVKHFPGKTGVFLKDLAWLSANNVRFVTSNYLKLITNVNIVPFYISCVLDFTHFLSHYCNILYFKLDENDLQAHTTWPFQHNFITAMHSGY